MASQFLPPISNLVSSSAFPTELGTVEGVLSNFLDSFRYKNLSFSKSHFGEAGFYSLTVVPNSEVAIEIPGTNGLALILNPGSSGTNEFPLSFEYTWEVLKYARKFNSSSFTEAIPDIFHLFIAISGASPKVMMEQTISTLVDDPNPIQKFVSDVNSRYNPSAPIQINPLALDLFDDIYQQIVNSPNSLDIKSIILLDYVEAGLDFNQTFERLNRLFKIWLGDFTYSDFKKFLSPKFKATITSIDAGLRFPVSIFRQVDSNNIPLLDINGNEIPGFITFNVGSLGFDSENGFEFINENSFSFSRSEILRSGFILEVDDMKVDLSRTANIPEAIADGRPTDFIGAYIKEGRVSFPTNWQHDNGNSSAELIVNNLLVGTGGLSGSISLIRKQSTPATQPALIRGTFGQKFKWTLDTFSLTFQQNAIIASDISGTMTIPVHGSETTIDIRVHIGTDGEFYVTAIQETGISLPLGNVANITLFGLSLGRQAGRFFIAANGKIDFNDLSSSNSFIGDNLPKGIEVKKVIIWDDGEIEFEGGVIAMPDAITLKLPPVTLSITAMGFGSHEQDHQGLLRKYKYFEFSGGVAVHPGGVDARGDGVQFYFTVDNSLPTRPPHFFVRIRGIAIDMIIPGSASPEKAAVILHGYLAMKDPAGSNPDAGSEYAGAIDFTLPRLKMGGSAAMRLNPKVPAFVIDAGLEMSSPILLGSTGLGIYGFRGLLGLRYVASKTETGLAETDEWWRYYKAKVPVDNKEGIFIPKMSQENGFSLGAGVSLATAVDSGRAFSSKLFFLLSLPDVFLLQGQAQILKQRIGLDTTQDPPFFALIAISQQSVEAAFGVTYKLPDEGNSGWISDMNGLIELGFFFGNSSAWYVNIGRDLPADRRVTARLFTLFNSYAYLMLASSGIKAGAGVSFALNKKFGPLRAELSAYLDVAGHLSFKPKQIGGSIQLGGSVGLYIFSFGFNVSVAASLAAEAPKPFIITGSLKVCITVLKKERCAEFDFTWSFDPQLNQSENEILGDPSSAAKAVNMQSRETYPVITFTLNSTDPIPALSDSNYWGSIDNTIIPVDSYIDIEFKKGVYPQNDPSLLKIGGYTMGADYIEYSAPQRGKSDRVRHDYLLNKVEIFSWNPTAGAWQPYDVYAALTPLQQAPFIPPNTLSNLKSGYWQITDPNKYNKLRLLAADPLSYMTLGSGDLIPEDLGVTNETIFCEEEPIDKTCITFDGFVTGGGGVNSMTVPAEQLTFYKGVLFVIHGSDGQIVTQPWNGFTNAMSITDDDVIEIFFQEPVACITLQMQTIAQDVTVSYYKKEEQSQRDSSNMPQFQYSVVQTTVLLPADLNQTVEYEDALLPISKITIKGGTCITFPGADSPLICDADITIQAKDIQRFFGRLSALGQLTSPFFIIYPDVNLNYNTYFYDTSLYTLPAVKGLQIIFSQTFKQQDKLSFNVQDNNGYSCDFTLELVSPNAQFDFNFITGYKNIRPHPDDLAEGANTHFLVDVTFQVPGLPPQTVVMHGESCYTIINCYKECFTHIYKFCYLPLADYLYNQTIPSASAVSADNTSMLLGIQNSINPIWRPHTHYAIRVETKEDVLQENSALTNYHRAFVLGFRTAGPIGHFHYWFKDNANPAVVRDDYQDLLAVDHEDSFKLSGLRHYIDYTKSYPNADGNVINAKPLFYGDPQLLLFYRFNYVYEFFQNWASYNGTDALTASLEAVIKDPIEPPLDANQQPTVADRADTEWAANETPTLTPDITSLNNMIQNAVLGGSHCEGPDTTPLTPMGVNNAFTMPQPLEPLKLYTAIFNAKYKVGTATEISREVHRYPFQTSRYADFAEQVQSYVLLRDTNTQAILKSAIFETAPDVSYSLVVAQSIVAGTMLNTDPLIQEAALPFDRLIDRVFKLGALMPPATTEFNIVHDSANSQVLGILIRNPEPFADPKMPEDVLMSTGTPAIELRIDTGSGFGPASDYKALWSKDRSSIFVTNSDNSMDLPVGTLEFTFRYHLYNGTVYTVTETEIVTIILS